MTKKTIDEQIKEAEERVRKLKEKKVRNAEVRDAKRYRVLCESIDGIDKCSDVEFRDFVMRLQRVVAANPNIVPTSQNENKNEAKDEDEK